MSNIFKKIGCMADFESEIASDAYDELSQRYNLIDALAYPPDYCDVIITLGGDGMMLKALHYVMGYNIPILGLNRGSIGFLLNDYSPHDLEERLQQAVITTLYPLEMIATDINGVQYKALAVNEVSLLRETSQSAKIKISINGKSRLDHLIADGVLVATPAGSSAYNFAAHGPIIPLEARILALTPISPFRPRRWRGALISHHSHVRFDIMEPEKRPVSAVADSIEVRDAVSVEVRECTELAMRLLFDPGNILQERVLKEQFLG